MIKVLVFPRNATNPYQDLLYGAMPSEEVEIAYYPMPTWSQTLNLLLFPFVLTAYRVRGYRLLHVHWWYFFAPVWVVVPCGRWLMQRWYGLCLRVARILRYRVVWTAHNIVPLSRVFHDDVAARRRLLRVVSAVIVHNKATVGAIEEFGSAPIECIPFGPYRHYPDEISRDEARRRLDLPSDERVATFIGAIEDYKGVDLLLEAAASMDEAARLHLVIAGGCRSPQLRRRLQALAEPLPRVVLHTRFIPDDELQVYLRAADVAVLPFRRITNSSSLLLVLNFGLPVVMPALAELEEIPENLSIRYDPGSRVALTQALEDVATMEASALQAMSRNAISFVTNLSWESTASETIAVYRLALGQASSRTRRDLATSTGTPQQRPRK